MKTYGVPLSTSKFLIVCLTHDITSIYTIVQTFHDQATITIFDNIDNLWGWFQAGNKANLVIANVKSGGITLLENIGHNNIIFFPPVILLVKTITTDLQENARLLKALDIFSSEVDAEKLKMRIDYLIQKEAYMNASSRWANDLPKMEIPLWKRVLDITVSLIVLVVFSPVFLLAAVLIYIEHPGPIFYSSKRVGKDYMVFDMYKFRSMRPDADKLLTGLSAYNIYNTAESKETSNTLCEICQSADLPCQSPLFLKKSIICEKEFLQAKRAEAMFTKYRNDPRITKVGSFLRNSSIDELPQIFNILRGDMSLVGNRPLPIYEAERLTTKGYVQRFAAPAGLTGLWQVTKRAKSQVVVSDLERIQLDILYAKKFSFRTDLSIMIKTVTAVFQQDNV